MKTLRLSDIATQEILEALELSARMWKDGLSDKYKSAISFSEDVIQNINEQICESCEISNNNNEQCNKIVCAIYIPEN